MRAVRLRPIAKRPSDPGRARLTCGITLIRQSSRTRSRDDWALIGLETHGGDKGGDRTLVVFESVSVYVIVISPHITESAVSTSIISTTTCTWLVIPLGTIHVATACASTSARYRLARGAFTWRLVRVALVVISRICHTRRCSALHREPRISRAYS